MVFVIQDQPGKNLLPARDYGKLKFMLPAAISQYNTEESVDKLYNELLAMRDDDYLLLIGDPVMIGAAVAIAGKILDGCIKILKWDKQEKKYYEVELQLP
jgi:hypothetical protein